MLTGPKQAGSCQTERIILSYHFDFYHFLSPDWFAKPKEDIGTLFEFVLNNFEPDTLAGREQGTFFGEPIIKTQPRVRNTSQDIDPFQAAGGGIAKLAGVSSGPPPESGPNSQGLQGLMKRVKRI